MTNLFQVGVSALLSNQRALSTTSHNIANVSTPGYSRQRVELAGREPQLLNGSFFGRGVEVTSVTRIVDLFLQSQLRVSTTNHRQIQVFNEFAGQINNLVADPNAGLSPALQGFFSGLQALADDPASAPARQVFLSDAETMVARFNDQSGRLVDISNAVNFRVETTVDEINSVATAIADLNRAVVLAKGAGQGEAPNDLLDQREVLLTRLSELVGTTVIKQDDGSTNVTVGNGQALIIGADTQALSVVNSPLDASRREVAFTIGGSQIVISGQLSGGELGGTLTFRDDMLEPARNALGRVAAVLALTINAQHREGMDLDGNLGGDLFSLPAADVLASGTNTGTLAVSLDPNNLGALTDADYSLRHDGTSFLLTNLTTNSTQTLTGSGPFNVDGMIITVGLPPAVGDSYRLHPTKPMAGGIALRVTEPRQIAAAVPIRTSALLSNLGSAQISAGEVLDATDPGLLTSTTLVFNSPPGTYQVNGVGPLIPYSSGANIDINGARITITGTPAAGDQFLLEANTGGVGDNRNGLLLADLQSIRVISNGTASYQDAYSRLVADVGATTQQSEVSTSALAALLDNALQARESISGVNLDEEAANLLRFQQAYQAAAQVIAAAQQTFNALIGVLR